MVIDYAGSAFVDRLVAGSNRGASKEWPWRYMTVQHRRRLDRPGFEEPVNEPRPSGSGPAMEDPALSHTLMPSLPHGRGSFEAPPNRARRFRFMTQRD